MQPLSTHVRGLRIHSMLAGDIGSEATPAILVHGLGVSGRYFYPLAERLAKDRMVIVPDLPGSGLSERPRHILDARELSECLETWLRTLGLGRVSLVANSFGSQVCAELAVRRPDLVERIVMIGPTVDWHWPTIAKQLPRWLLEAGRETLALFPILVSDYLRYGFRRFFTTARFALRHDFASLLPRIQAPSLILRGERDAFVSPEWLHRIGALIPRARTAEVPGAAHAAHFSAPDEVAALVRPFLRRVVSARCSVHLRPPSFLAPSP